MSKRKNRLSRRSFMKLGGGFLAAAATTRYLPRPIGQSGEVVQAAPFSQVAPTPPDIYLVGTDGWIYLPGQVPIPGTTGQYYIPDDLAPPGFTAYMFGYRDVTGQTEDQIWQQKMKCQATAPLFWVNQEQEYRLKLGNLGLQMRPDLIDDHTVHWHGFRNAWPIFDGEPHSSVSVPIGRDLTLYYKPHHPGTYMYHCHFEETEHLHMGMTGSVFVRPVQDQGGLTQGGQTIPSGRLAGNPDPAAPMGYVYNDGVLPGDPLSTAFDREFVLCMTDVWAEAHWDDSHIQLPDWTNFRADYNLMNGRVYPDTIAPNGQGTDANGDLIAPPGHPELQYQPISSLIACNAGDRVLIRLINLTFSVDAFTVPGLKLKVVGQDATHLKGTDGTVHAYDTNTIFVGTGGTVDAIFEAPQVDTMTKYLLYNRNYSRLSNPGTPGPGGQMTEIHVYPAGTLPPQTGPNT
ncbi:MAG: multicopper oxidase domain-containing protein [Anaerolineae bacterium]